MNWDLLKELGVKTLLKKKKITSNCYLSPLSQGSSIENQGDWPVMQTPPAISDWGLVQVGEPEL